VIKYFLTNDTVINMFSTAKYLYENIPKLEQNLHWVRYAALRQKKIERCYTESKQKKQYYLRELIGSNSCKKGLQH